MKKKTPQNSPKKKKATEGIKPYKKNISELFAFWLSMPFAIRELSGEKLQKMGYDAHDEEFMKLLSVRTRTEFGKTFKVDRKQLYTWEHDAKFQEQVQEFNRNSNVLAFKKDVDFNFTMKTIQEADSGRVKLWKQLFESWVEKAETRSPELEKIGEQIRKIAERKPWDD